MTERAPDYPWLFVNTEMLRFAGMLSGSKLKSNQYDLAKSVFELTSSRFQSPKHSVQLFRMYMPEPAYKTWSRGGKAGALKQCIVLKSMLLATGQFEEDEIRIMRKAAPHFAPASSGHYYIRVKAGKGWVTQDPWGREWKVPYGEKYGFSRGSAFASFKIRGAYDEKRRIGKCELYIKK
jgi:hypothetical protein